MEAPTDFKELLASLNAHEVEYLVAVQAPPGALGIVRMNGPATMSTAGVACFLFL